MRMKSTFLATATSLLSLVATAQHVITFDDTPLPDTNMDYSMLVDEGAYSFVSGMPSSATFYGRKESWGGFSGFTYSNSKDSLTVGSTNDHAAFPAIGALSTNQYAVAYGAELGAQVQIAIPLAATAENAISGLYITNATFAVRSMETGDAFAKKFGGEDGTDPDWFLLTIVGRTSFGETVDSVEFYLADFRSEAPEDDYIVKDWQFIDLSAMNWIDSLSFRLSSSDNGEFGMNTPAYFCLDEIQVDVRPFSIPNVNNELKVRLFPNPVVNQLFIDGTSGAQYNVKVIDVAGKLVMDTHAQENLSLVQLSSGTYMVYLEDNKSGKNKVQKIIKQ